MSNCGPLSYTISLGQSGIIPTFIKFSASNMVISVYTNDGSNEGIYPITITGTTEYYNTKLSVVKQDFQLNVICKPKILAVKDYPFT